MAPLSSRDVKIPLGDPGEHHRPGFQCELMGFSSLCPFPFHPPCWAAINDRPRSSQGWGILESLVSVNLDATPELWDRSRVLSGRVGRSSRGQRHPVSETARVRQPPSPVPMPGASVLGSPASHMSLHSCGFHALSLQSIIRSVKPYALQYGITFTGVYLN